MNIIKKILIFISLGAVFLPVNAIENSLEDTDNNGLLEIHTQEELISLQMDSGTKFSSLLNDGFFEGFELNNDIDLTDINWIPIKGFNATFNGNNHVISNLTINLPDSNNIGLFGSVDAAVITNLIMDNAFVLGLSNVGALVGESLSSVTKKSSISNISIQGQIRGTINVGGVVGYAYTTNITTAHVIGDSSIQGEKSVGGIAGSFQQGSINTSSGNATITSTEEDSIMTGGLIGYATGCNVLHSSFVGDVNGTKFVGGLIGFLLNCNVKQSYSISNVKGTSVVGGLIGDVIASPSGSVALSESYASGKLIVEINDNSNIGGLIGFNPAELYIVQDSYFDISHDTPNLLTDNATHGVSTAELKCSDTVNPCGLFMSWDRAVWQFGTLDDYPTFTPLDETICQKDYTIDEMGICVKDIEEPSVLIPEVEKPDITPPKVDRPKEATLNVDKPSENSPKSDTGGSISIGFIIFLLLTIYRKNRFNITTTNVTPNANSTH